MKQRSLLVSIAVLALLCAALRSQAQPAPADAPELQELLTTGTMNQAQQALAKRVQGTGRDDARFALGVAQFLAAVERMAGSMYQFGLHNEINELPFFRLPVPPNPDPRPVKYQDIRGIFDAWVSDMEAARQTLGQIKDLPAVALDLPIARMHIDLNGDGEAGEEEMLWNVFRAVTGARELPPETQQFSVRLDGGDVHWLIGYSHLLSALSEMILAYDEQELFDRTAHMLFANPDTPYAQMLRGQSVFTFGGDVDIADIIAFIHLFNFPVKEPARLNSALEHLRAMLAQSRKSWELILAETDDEREWIPSPRQSSVIPDARVSDEMLKGWTLFLDESEALLSGKKLIPFWRGDGTMGVNLQRFFTEPQSFDLVLWVQGTAARPYLEQGELTTGEMWNRIQQLFGGNFLPFAVWFN